MKQIEVIHENGDFLEMEDVYVQFFEKRPYNRIFLSADMLRSNEEAYALIRKIAGKNDIRRLARTEADPLDEVFLNVGIERVCMCM